MTITVELPEREGEGITDIETAVADGLVTINARVTAVTTEGGDIDDAVDAFVATAQTAAIAAIEAAETASVSAVGDAAADAILEVANAGQGTLYPDIATGRAAVSTGQVFIVAGTGDAYAISYLKTGASTQTMLASAPSSAVTTMLAASVSLYVTPPATTDALTRVLAIELYNSVDGVAVTLPAQICVRECGRDALSGGRFRLRLSGFNGVSTYTALTREEGNGTYLPADSTYTGVQWIDLYTVSTALGPASGTLVGRALINFSDGGVFGSYASTIAYSLGAIYGDRLQSGPRFDNDVEAVARTAAAAVVAANVAFLPTATDTYIQPIVADIYIEGGDAGERYCLNYEAQDLGSGNGRVRFTIYDTIAGIDVCTRVVSGTKAAIVADTRETLVLYQNDMAGFTGITATIWVNWANITSWPGGITSYTTMTQTGLKANRTITPEEMRARFKRGPEPKTLLTVGTGTVTATHFNTVLAAVQSLYDPAYTIIRSGPFPMSDKCSFSNQVMVRVVDDAYSEQIALVNLLGGDQSPLVLPPWITIDLPQDAILYSNEATNTGPTIEAPFPFRIRGGTIDCQGSGYAIHIDGANGTAKRATVGKAILRYPMVSIMEQATFKGGTTQSTWVIGTGLSNGQDFIVDRCRVVMRKAAVTGIGMHDSPSTTDAAEILITDTYVNDVAIGAAYGIQMLKSSARTAQHRVTVRNTNTGSIGVGNSGGGSAGYIRNGKIDSSITITGTLDT